ncbi:MAG TPA: DUF3488 and transglutaminase-like domain-containing protein [Gemmataceae bacterium]|nr:DUF3488 and transglutaminase-like domain-containing protein [Gemmataceae bacterium]
MRSDLGFRLSNYLTLGLACICLGYAEQFYLPGITIFVVLVLLLLAAAFVAEGRRWSLPIRASNVVGLVLAAGSGAWVTLCLVRPRAAALEDYPLPLALLPYLGPLLPVLLVAKLFRPKRAADVWALQGMGLMQVGLGCVLADDSFFGVLLLAYLAGSVWFLAEFHLQREVAGRSEPALGSRPASRSAYPVGRWTLAVMAVGLLLFLLIPRFGATQWSLLGPLHRPGDSEPGQTGFSEMIDLNRSGTLAVNDEVALVVYAENADGSPKTDLNPDQRWRGAVLDRYYDGRWVSGSLVQQRSERGFGMPFRRPVESVPLADRLPDLGPQQYFLNFTIDRGEVGGLILAEPVVVHPRRQMVPVARQPGRPPPDIQFLRDDWTLLPREQEKVSYRQVVVPLEEPDLSMPVRLSGQYISQISWQRNSSLKEWTDQLLRDLAARAAYQLSPDDLQYIEAGSVRFLRPEYHEKVARALTDYLATSGDYTYTLELRRHERRLDPIEDFLRNVKQGHCERYAAALALMLRSQGIPARVVQGFRGGENQEDGHYILRHSDAHSWVEALVPRVQPNGQVEMHWLTLDGTPSIEAPTPSRFSPAWWLDHSQRLSQEAWKEFVIGYDRQQQTDLWQGWRSLAEHPDWRTLGAGAVRLVPWLALAPLVLLGLRVARRLRAGRRAALGPSLSEVVFYDRLLTILARRCQLRRGPAQTPREFGEAARQLLQGIPAAASLADVPVQAADLFYRVRYGRLPLSAQEEQEMNRRLGQLDAALNPAPAAAG